MKSVDILHNRQATYTNLTRYTNHCQQKIMLALDGGKKKKKQEMLMVSIMKAHVKAKRAYKLDVIAIVCN